MPATLTHHRFSVADYEQMTTLGILNENDRVELIRGEILNKMTIGDLHVAIVNRLNHLFVKRFGQKAIVSIQNPIRLADSEPEPDLALLRQRDDFYASGKPGPTDVFLVVEVADTTLDFDRDVKGPLYAENGVIEYWLVNLIDDCVEVHRQPQNGVYQQSQVFRRGEDVELVSLGQAIPVGQILAPNN